MTTLAATLLVLLPLTPQAIATPWDVLDDAALIPSLGYRVGAHYGRGAGRLIYQSNDQSSGYARCSGALIGATEVLTAKHCQGAWWGSFQLYHSPDVEAYVRERLRGFGLTEAAIAAIDIRNTLGRWNCNRTSTYGSHDIAVYSCEQKYVSGVGLVGPGEIFPPLQVSRGGRQRVAMHGLSVQNPSGPEGTQVLLAPGSVKHTDITCSNWFGVTDYDHCFEHDAQSAGGSSGGPIVDKVTHEVIGVYQAEFWDHTGDYNIGAWLPSAGTSATRLTPSQLDEIYAYFEVYQDRGDDPDFVAGPPAGTWGALLDAIEGERDIDRFAWLRRSAQGWSATTYGWTQWAGGTGGQHYYGSCPTGMLATGIVATTEAGYVGNFGLVCQPESIVSTYFSPRTWTVTAPGGSRGTGFERTHGAPLDTYLAEVHYDTGDFLAQVQTVRTCPEGDYLVGLSVSVRNGKLAAVHGLACAGLADANHGWRWFQGDIGVSGGEPWLYLMCPRNPNGRLRAAKILSIRSGWYTDGLQLGCL